MFGNPPITTYIFSAGQKSFLRRYLKSFQQFAREPLTILKSSLYFLNEAIDDHLTRGRALRMRVLESAAARSHGVRRRGGPFFASLSAIPSLS
jgi:hypothetical protein